MDAAKAILERLGIGLVEEMAVNESYTIEVEDYEDLTIEKVGENELSVAHHYRQRGDLMCDPEIVFHIDGGVWTPIEYTQHPRIYHHDETEFDLAAFITNWSANLRRQGFVEAASEVTVDE